MIAKCFQVDVQRRTNGEFIPNSFMALLLALSAYPLYDAKGRTIVEVICGGN